MVQSLPELVRTAVREHADRPSVLLKEGDALVSRSYAWFGEEVEVAACGLLAAGVQPGDRVVLLSENCPEWFVADCAILAAGAVTVPIYPSLPADQVAPLISRVGARLVIVEDATQLAKIEATRDSLPAVERVLLFRPGKVADQPLVRRWAEVLETGRGQQAELREQLEQRLAGLSRESLATIIFTSGTTGVPKAAMLTHGNLLSNIEAADQRVRLRAGERFVTFLPQSHVFQRMVSFLGTKCGAAALYNESLRALLPNLRATHPTVLIVVPRFLELMRERVTESLAGKSGLAGLIARWGMGVADRYADAVTAGRQPGLVLRA
ncbi:MAG: AMP-binding protein, partial [Armatimonadetes bacterium]|nr:AMP-binding protein [Armatimonadota bacterium]